MNSGRLKLNKIWHSFPKRLLIIVCITVIPVNILAVIVSSIVLIESRDSITSSYQRELDIYMGNTVAMINRVDDWFYGFVEDNLASMMVEGGYNAILSVNLTQELGSVLETYDIKGFSYLWEQQEDGRLYVQISHPETSSYEANELLKLDIASRDPYKGLTQGWHIEEFNNRYYYYSTYSYTNYTIGFGIDLDAEMADLFVDSFERTKYVLLESHDAMLKLYSNNNALRLTEAERLDALKPGLNSSFVSWESDNLRKPMRVILVNRGFWDSIPKIYWLLQLLAVFSIAGIIILWKMIRIQVIEPLVILYRGMQSLEENILDYRIEEKAETAEFMYLFDTFNRMALDIKTSHERDIEMYRIQISNLKLQVNPHMLLNSLNTIYSLAQIKDYVCIQDYCMNLVSYFRYVLKEDQTLVSLESEMAFVKSFIEIQKVRFPDEFICVHNVDEGAAPGLIPPLLIQNFLENAMKHARKSSGIIEVLINIRRQGQKLIISICDTGKGIREDILKTINSGEIYIDQTNQKHIGIWNCRRRLQTFFGQEHVLKVTSIEGQGTQVWIEMPYIEDTSEIII